MLYDTPCRNHRLAAGSVRFFLPPPCFNMGLLYFCQIDDLINFTRQRFYTVRSQYLTRVGDDGAKTCAGIKVRSACATKRCHQAGRGTQASVTRHTYTRGLVALLRQPHLCFALLFNGLFVVHWTPLILSNQTPGSQTAE